MSLNNAKIKELRRIGHDLKPIVMVSENGVSEGVLAELDRALNDHELIKAKLSIGDREARQQVIGELCKASQCELVQSIGKTILLYRAAAKPNAKLSNVSRHYQS